ncbi:uncharacterized protein LOC132189547 [Corylus avellana]|uniref:uncharacterized protein LOC132189547 n=1 Tax=Corylus avellana TaxID=13451 RepID=UPI00286AD695|nr:uncharacterized protein LOC132189547 [Corylus avellana]
MVRTVHAPIYVRSSSGSKKVKVGEQELVHVDDFLRGVYGAVEVRVHQTEVKNDDDEEEVFCRTCREQILGPALKCSGRNIFFHPPCLNLPTNGKALIFHLTEAHDRLLFQENVENDGEKGIVCSGCEKRVKGRGFKCPTADCDLVFHESCVEPPTTIQDHPFHPNHTLVGEMPKKKYCNACGTCCNTYFFYSCSECDFNLDFTCATCSQIKNADNCQHKFISFLKQIEFTCEACGEKGKELATQCRICHFLIHGKCARFLRTIWTARHHHSLAFTCSLRDQVEGTSNGNILCNLCWRKVKTEYATYYCKECDYVAHLECAFQDDVTADLKLLPEEPIDLVSDSTEVEVAEQMQNFGHPHELILSNEELTDEKLCDGCMGFICTPFFSCPQCNFFLHNKCVQLPKKKRHLLHPHLLTCFSSSTFSGELFSCDACERVSNGFSYRCDTCDFDIDLQCFSISETLKHDCHPHSLSLAVNSNRSCHVCNCTSRKERGVFVCKSGCDFTLGLECATLPLEARHIYDDHPLKLTYSVEVHCEYYCLICENERDPNCWFYYCEQCDFPAHLQCVLGKYPYVRFGNTCTSQDAHEHPLTFVPKTESSPPCDGCGENFDGMALECTKCKFNVHYLSSCLKNINYEIMHAREMVGESQAA